MDKQPNHRAFYRIQYPQAVRPTFALSEGGREFPVVDCSERGIRFAPDWSEHGVIATGERVQGQLRFYDGNNVYVSGVVVRVQGGEVAVHLRDWPIPLKRILSEQILLHRRYPGRTP